MLNFLPFPSTPRANCAVVHVTKLALISTQISISKSVDKKEQKFEPYKEQNTCDLLLSSFNDISLTLFEPSEMLLLHCVLLPLCQMRVVKQVQKFQFQ